MLKEKCVCWARSGDLNVYTNIMNNATLKKKSATDWKNLTTLPDSAINLTDSPELDMSFFKNGELRLPKPKKAVSLRLDDDVFNWFRHQGKGYQTRINAALRLYMQVRTLSSTGVHSQKKRAKSNSRKTTGRLSALDTVDHRQNHTRA